VHLTTPKADGRRVYVTERKGTVRVVVDGSARPEPFLDVRGAVESGFQERGLLSIAFAPDFASSRLFYAFYTAKSPLGELTVAEYRAQSPESASATPVRIVLKVPHSSDQNHNGGQLQFGPDGLLYVSTGDGGGANDTDNDAQNAGSRLGKILRLDVRQPTPSAQVYALGLRNPWRFSFDRQTGDMLIGDVGQGEREEIDFAPAGAAPGLNFGWRCWEGTIRTPGVASCETPGHIRPVIEHTHSAGWSSITGGYVVRDPALPALLGRYLYGDVSQPKLWSATVTAAAAAGDAVTPLSVETVVSFGEDACGRILVASLGGKVSRVQEGAAPPPPCVPAAAAPAAGGGGGGGPAAPPTAVDSAAPVLRLTGGRRQRLRRRGLLVRATCSELCSVGLRGRVALPRRRDVAAKRRTATLRPGRRHSFRLRMGKRSMRRVKAGLRRHGRVRAKLTVVASDAAGNRVTVRRRLTLVR